MLKNEHITKDFLVLSAVSSSFPTLCVCLVIWLYEYKYTIQDNPPFQDPYFNHICKTPLAVKQPSQCQELGTRYLWGHSSVCYTQLMFTECLTMSHLRILHALVCIFLSVFLVCSLSALSVGLPVFLSQVFLFFCHLLEDVFFTLMSKKSLGIGNNFQIMQSNHSVLQYPIRYSRIGGGNLLIYSLESFPLSFDESSLNLPLGSFVLLLVY